MAIRTYQSFSGYVSTEPSTEPTKDGMPRFYARAGQRQARRESDGSFTKLPTQYIPIVALGAAAEEATALLSKGDSFTAEGRFRSVTYTTKAGKTVEAEEFEVWKIGRRPNAAERSTPAEHAPTAERQTSDRNRDLPPEFVLPHSSARPVSALAM